MALIDTFMPTFSVRRVERVSVRSAPEFAWNFVRRLDVLHLAFLRRLFDAQRGSSLDRTKATTFAEFSAKFPGFLLLADTSGGGAMNLVHALAEA